MPKAGLVGPTYLMRSRNFNAERSINLYPVKSEVEGSKDVAALYGTPGLKLFSLVGNGPSRGNISCGNGRTFSMSGNGFYEILSNGSNILHGTISTFSGPVSMSENGLQILIANGMVSYIFTFATNALVQITDIDFPGADYVTFQDGYFIVTPPNNQGKFYISSIYDGLTWDALDFATAESSPDGLIAAFSNGGQLYLFGTTTTELWYNNGNVNFPYTKLSGGRIEVGTVSAFSIGLMDNTLFWVGQNNDGTGIVYRANGTIPLRVSNQSIEFMLAEVNKSVGLSGIVGFPYQQEGHLFFVVTGTGMKTTLVYDANTQMWHERAYLNNGVYEPWLGMFQCFSFNKNLVGDRLTGSVYQIDPDTFTDNGQEIKRTRVFTHLYNEGDRFKISSLEVDFEGGVGNIIGQGDDPKVWLRMSTDFGHTWSSEYYAAIGKLGNYIARAEWRRLGVQRAMTFEVATSEPVKISICGSTFNGR